MPTVNIQLFEGRSIDKKRELVKVVTEATCKVLECPEELVDVILVEVKKDNWARSGKLWSD